MDLRHLSQRPSDEERGAVDALLGEIQLAGATSPLREALGLRHLLLPALHAVQARFGWIPPGALGYVCERLHVPPAEAYGVATFYALFALTERPPIMAHVCDDLACHARGAEELCAELTRSFGPSGAARGGAAWQRSPCLGKCERAPVALVTKAGSIPREAAFGDASAARVIEALGGDAPAIEPALLPQVQAATGASALRLLARVGKIDPTSLDDYRAHGGYAALRTAIDEGPAHVIREVTESGLVGRGGAAFPTGRKWQAVASAAGPTKYLVCNADESEPGTFKDRVLLEEDPYAIVEAMTIAGLAVGANTGFVYVRGEYPLATARIEHAVRAARARGLLGGDIMGRGVSFDIDVRRGAGAYICGEETALFASLEGYRGEPRTKPPFPVEVGLFGRPTVVNNVETLANIPWIVTHGAAAYRSVGTSGSPGTRLFCVSGRVAQPGLVELPFGASLRDLIDQCRPLGPVRAVLLGGAAGTFLSEAELDLPLTFEDTRRVKASLGSGVVMVFDHTVDLGLVAKRLAHFFREESCGQCVPCRVGTVRQEELVTRLNKNAPLGTLARERALLMELGQAMRDASICGLGQTASTAIESLVEHGWLGHEGPP